MKYSISSRSRSLRPSRRLLPSRLCLFLAANLALVGGVAGCSGSSSGTKSPANVATANAGRSGRATFTVLWPAGVSDSSSRLIPEAAKTIRVDVLQGETTVATRFVTRPAGAGKVDAAFDVLPPGTLVVQAAAFPGLDGSGVALARVDNVPLHIEAGQTTVFGLTLSSTIQSLEMSSSGSVSVPVGATLPLGVVARDAAGNVVLLTPQRLNWTSDNAQAATVNDQGAVTGVAVGTTVVRVADTESGKSASVNVTVTSPPTPTPTPTPTSTNFGLANSAWPKFQRDANNSGQVPPGSGDKPATGTRAWATNVQGIVSSSAAIGVDGTIYVGVSPYFGGGPRTSSFYALDGTTGAIKWSFPGPLNNGVYTTPAIGEDNTVYFAGDKNVFAVDGATGAVRWKTETEFSLEGSPALGPGKTLYIGDTFGHLHALDTVTGAIRWRLDLDLSVAGAPAVGSDGTVYITGWKSVHAVSKEGVLRWKYTTGDIVLDSASLSADGRTVFIPSYDHHVYALDAATGALRWQSPDLGNSVSTTPSVARNGNVIVGCRSGLVYALNGATGAVVWSHATSEHIQRASAAIGSDGTIYIGCGNGRMNALDGATGAEKWVYRIYGTVSTTPAIGRDGTLYFGGFDSYFHAVK